MNKWIIRSAFLVLVVGGGILIGTLTAPGSWYAALQKPFFNPPNWIFAPVWTVLYVLIAMVGWRLFEAHRRSSAYKLWWGQLALNFLWSPMFFALQQLWLAFLIIIALWTIILLLIRATWELDRVSSFALMPYLAWVSFATALNLSLAALN